ncbi:MAG: histone deacetylase, partial [Candidatus Binatia bacterium]
DWDVHHGNGTQHCFWGEESVLYCSLHQHPFYPGTGAPDELGTGAAAGRTVNLPMQAGWGGQEYTAAMREVVLPIAREFDPDFVLVSAGFDAHRDDPLAMMQLEESDFGRMACAMIGLADECCEGRLVMLLEGGYDLDALRSSVRTVIDTLREPASFDADAGELSSWGRATLEAMRPYWTLRGK